MVSARPPLEPEADRIARIAALAAVSSFEITPKDRTQFENVAGLLMPRSLVHITHLPGVPWQDVITSAALVSRLGHVPVPHIAARNFKGEAEAKSFVSRLAEESGVTCVFLIGGDASVAQGPFRGALDLLETGVIETCGVRTVGFGTYPEGHPTITDSELEAALLAKLASAEARGLETFVVTQFCFEAETIVRFLQHLRALHVRTALRVGIAGPTRPDALLRFALRCGVGPSIRTLTKQRANIAKLLALWEPDSLVQTLAETPLVTVPVAGLHFYTLGGLKRSVEWANAVAAGRIALRHEGNGFHVVA